MYPRRILLKILRDVWHIKGRAIIIIVITAVSVSIYVGTHTALHSIEQTALQLYADHHLADLQINFIPTTEDELPPFSSEIPGIHRMEQRLILPGSIETNDDKLVASLSIFLDSDQRQEVNQLKIIEGTYLAPDRDDAVLLDYSFARDFGYQVGDIIMLGLQGFFAEYEIIGLAVNPEFLIATASPDLYIPIKGSLGIVYASMDAIENLFGYNIYNNLSVTFAAGADPEEVKHRLEEAFLSQEIEIDSELFQEDLY
ncbi:hypothetical protein GF339_17530, partial [candidate division KSB3 bacterium]|nr:hypothetical protein [candidate division KSB3 bacterium]MBD3326390.1 hypothetical protein [candidate division KSB3 bacterium]